MKKRIYRRICPHHKMPAALMLAILFLLPFSACSNSKSTPAPAESSTAEPVPGSADRTERLVYVPSYEVLPVSMDPITVRFPVETEENVYFFRLVQSAEGAGYRLMRGGKDAAEAVTVAAFAPEDYVERIFLTDEGTAWINQTNFTTGDAALLEISLSSGEILHRAPLDTANGTVTGIFDLPDGSLGVLTVLPNMEQALFSMNEAGNFVQVEAPLNTNGDFFNNVTVCGAAGSGLSAGECLAYDNEYLFAFTPGSAQRRELFCWADWGISSFYTTPLSMNDGVIRLLDNRYKEYITLTPTPENEVQPRQELTMACLYKEGSLEDAVRDFNRRSTEWYVTIKDYSDGQAVTTEVQDRAITALNLDVVSGNMPDLIAVQNGIPFKSYGKKGVLRDLTSDLETEGIELLPQLQRAGTVDGKLVAVCGSFALLTAAGNRDMLGDAAGWSAADAMALAESLPDHPSVFSGSMTRDSFMNWLSYYLEGFLDWESGVVSFDTPEFRNMLTLAAALPADMPAENSADADVMEGRALVNPTAITSVRGWQVQDVICLGKLSTPGFPTGDGVGNLIYMQMPLAVSSNSSHIEGAMAFLKSILNNDSQNAITDFFPSTRPAFERQLAEAMREPSPEDGFTKVYNLPAGGQFLDPTVYMWENENEPQPRSILYWMDETGSTYREEKVYAMSEEQRERLLALLESAERAASYDKVIAGIVQEEAGAFFAGQRDIETVSRQIQSRAETYLAEQR